MHAFFSSSLLVRQPRDGAPVQPHMRVHPTPHWPTCSRSWVVGCFMPLRDVIAGNGRRGLNSLSVALILSFCLDFGAVGFFFYVCVRCYVGVMVVFSISSASFQKVIIPRPVLSLDRFSWDSWPLVDPFPFPSLTPGGGIKRGRFGLLIAWGVLRRPVSSVHRRRRLGVCCWPPNAVQAVSLSFGGG